MSGSNSHSIPIIGIPILNRGDLLARLTKSIDYPVESLFIINNGSDPSVTEAIIQSTYNENIKGVTVLFRKKNLGVAPSWNCIVNSNPNCPYWFIIASDMMFKPGEAKRMAEFAEANHQTHDMMYADGYSAFCMTQRGLQTVGLFDENIYPAYLEDSDHFYRVRLTGAVTAGFPDVKMIHGEPPYNGSSTIMSNEKFRAANGITHRMNFEYYMKKWGGTNGQEVFKHPFNNPALALDFWELDEAARKKREEAWRS